MLDKLKGYKTAIINGLMTVAGLAVSFGWISPELQAMIVANADAVLGAVMTLWGVVNIGLRKVTTTPLGSST